MPRSVELAAPIAAAAAVLAALLGGGFFPLPRMVVGVFLMAVWITAAAGLRGRPDFTEISLTAIVAWGVLSAAGVGSSPLAAKEVITVWMTAGLLYAICRRGGSDARLRALRVLTLGATLIAAAVLIEAAGSGLRVGGLLENPNIAAALMVPSLPLGWRVLREHTRWRWAWAGLVAAGILGTGSRAGLLAVVAVIGFTLPRGRTRALGLLGGSVIAVGVLAWRFVSHPDILAWHRVSIWHAVLKIWAERPLTGAGPGGLVEAAAGHRILHGDEIGHYQFVVGYAESTPLAILIQLGAVGLLLALLATWVWWSAAKADGVFDKPGVVAAIAAVVVLGLFHDFLTIDPVLWWWAVLLGCVTGTSRSSDTTTVIGLPATARWAAALTVIWLTAWGVVSPALARRVWTSGEASTEHVARVLRIEPWFSEAPASRVVALLAVERRWTWETAGEALYWARTARDLRPGLARRWADLGRVRLRIITDLGGTAHDVEAARAALDRACRLDPHLPWNWLERARLARVLGNSEDAIRLTRRALAEEPNTVRAWLTLGRLELELGRIDAARAALDEAELRLEMTHRGGLSDYDRELLADPSNDVNRLRRSLESHGRRPVDHRR